MAASRSPAVSASPTVGSPRPRSFRTIALSLTLALGIVAAAWAVGGRQGFDAIGSGGINQRLLPKVGEPAPAFRALTLSEKPVDSGIFAGKPLWINFWASWCAPCRAELPDMQVAASQLRERGMNVVAISLDEPTVEAAHYAMLHKVTQFDVLSDPSRSGTSAGYGVNNFPTHIFVDAEGIVRSVVLAPMSVEEALANGEKAINPSA